jgi:hypothetical protein
MIEELGNKLLIDGNGDCLGERLPETREIVDKINELIKYINSQKENKR